MLRTGESELYCEIPDALLERAARDPEHLALLRGIGLRSGTVVPLVARGRTLGALTLAANDSGGATTPPTWRRPRIWRPVPRW